MQYLMVGASLVLFYMLLLSFSEHFGFGGAYATGAVATILTITSYVFGITKNKKWSGVVLFQLTALYGFLFVLLQQGDFALIFGATGLWLTLAIIMYITRKINWFEISLSNNNSKGGSK